MEALCSHRAARRTSSVALLAVLAVVASLALAAAPAYAQGFSATGPDLFDTWGLGALAIVGAALALRHLLRRRDAARRAS